MNWWDLSIVEPSKNNGFFTVAVKSLWFIDLMNNENEGISIDRDNHNNKIGIEVNHVPVTVCFFTLYYHEESWKIMFLYHLYKLL